MFRSINHLLSQNPLRCAVGLAGGKCTVADIIIQKNNNEPWNPVRTASFASFGFLWCGGGQYLLFNRVFPWLFGTGIFNGCHHAVVKSLAFDQLIHAPFVYFPLFYFFREIPTGNKDIIPLTYSAWKREIVWDMTIQATIFLPVQVLNFMYFPKHIRVPTLNAVGFLYAMFLSYTKL